MKRVWIVGMSLAVVGPVLAWQAQQPAPGVSGVAPQIQNGRVEVRRGAALDREIAAISGASSTDPVWVAWRAPLIDGDRDMCGWYSDRLGTVRGMFVDDGQMAFADLSTGAVTRPQITPPTGPIPLEAGTGVVVLARLVGGNVERLRTAGDDCPMDAGGRTVYWLEGISPAESLRFLTALARADTLDRGLPDLPRRVAETAVRAIGYHKDAAADSALDQLAADHPDADVRRQAASTLASLRGAHGVQTLARLIAAAPDAGDRRSLTGALGQSRDAAVVAALRVVARDAEPRVRSEALYWLVLRGGAVTLPEALKVLASETDDTVKRRIVSALGRLPGDISVPALLQLARGSESAVVRKEAVSALSQSKDPRALALMEEILKR